MADKLGMMVEVNFESEDKVNAKLQALLKKLQEKNKLNVVLDGEAFKSIEQQFNMLKKKFEQSLKVNADTSGMKQTMDELIDNVDKLDKKQVKIVDGRTVQIIDQVKKNLLETERIINNIDSGSKTNVINLDYGKVQADLYKQKNSLQKDEFAIRERLIGQDGEIKSQLEQQLNIIRQQQVAVENLISKYKVQNTDKDNEHLIQKKQLISDLTIAQEKYNTKVNQESKDIQTKIKQYQDKMAIEIQSLQTKYKDIVPKRELENFQTALKKLNATSLKDLQSEFKTLDTQFKSLVANTKSSGINVASQDARGLSSLLSKDLIAFASWKVIGDAVMMVYRSIGDSVRFVYSMDTAMVNLKKITDETAESYKTFEIESNRVAKSIARGTTEVVDAVVAWKKAGYTLNEAQTLSKTTLIGANVGDVGVQDIQKFLVAPLKAWNIESEKSIRILDVMNNVSNQHAVTIQDLGESYARASSVMAMANNTLEETTALVTAAQAQTQLGGDTIGNGLRTIALRLTSMKDEEGNIIPRLAEDFEKVGVKLKDTNGRLLSTYEIIKQLNQVWNSGTLNEGEKLNLLEKGAGKMRSNILAAMIENFAEAEKTLQDALNSSNSAINEQNAYMDSLAAKVKVFGETLNGVYLKIISSDALKNLVDFGTGAVNALGVVIDKIGAFPTIITSATGAMFLFNKSFRDAAVAHVPFMTSLNSTSSSIKKYIVSQREATIAQIESGKSTYGLIAKLGALRVAEIATTATTIALQTALTMGLSLVITGVINGISKLYNTFINADKAVSDHKQKIADLTDKYNSLKSEIEQFKEIKNPTEDQKAYLGLLERELSLKEEILATEKRKLIDKDVFGAGVWGKGMSGDVKKDLKEVQNIFDQIQYTQDKISQKQQQGLSADNDIEQLRGLKNQLVEYEATFIERKKTLEDYAKTASESSKKGIDDLLHSINMMLPQLQSENNLVKSNTDELKKNTDAKIANANATDTQDSAEKKYQEEFTKSMDAIGEYRAMLKELQNDKGKYDPSKNLSTGTYKKIAEEMQHLIPYLNDEKSLYEEINRLISEQEGNAANSYRNMLLNSEQYLNANRGLVENVINDMQSMYGSYFTNIMNGEKASFDNAKTIAQKRAVVESTLINAMSQAWASYYRSMANVNNTYMMAPGLGDDDGASYIRGMNEEAYRKIQQLQQMYTSMASKFNAISVNIRVPDFSSPSSSNSSKTADELARAQEEGYRILEEISSKVIDMYKRQKDEELKILDDKMEAYQKFYDDKMALLEEQEENESFNKGLAKQQKQAQSIRDQINQLSLDSSREAKARIEELKKALAEQEEAINETIDNKSKEDRKKNLQQELEDYKKIIESERGSIEERYSDANLEKMAKEAILTGQFKGIGNNIQSLSQAMLNFTESTGEAYGVLGKKIQTELIERLQAAIRLMAVMKSDGTIDPDKAKGIIPGYSTGGIHTSTSLAMLHGSSSNPEIIFNADQAKKLFAFVKGLPGSITQFIKPQLPNFSNPALTTPSNVSLNFDSLINVEGNVDRNVMPSLQDLTNRVCEQITNTMRMQGLVRR